METGLLNFHDEENFATSIYDQGDISGMDGHASLLDMMHSDFQYGSDYLNQSTIHWDCDQEQEINGDIAVLPTPPSDCSSISNSKEDYHKVFFEWQEHLLSLQPLGPDDVDLRLDGQTVPEELPDNIFEDSFESKTNIIGDFLKSSLPEPSTPLNRSSTPVSHSSISSPSKNKSNVSLEGSCNVSLSDLDVNVSGIDVSALGINVSALDLKSDQMIVNDVEHFLSPEHQDSAEGKLGSSNQSEHKITDASCSNSAAETKSVKTVLSFPTSELFDTNNLSLSVKIEPSSLKNDLSVSNKLTSLEDLMTPLVSECTLKEPLSEVLSCSLTEINSEPSIVANKVPVLEAGNLESLLEQFEASLASGPSYSQSTPASPAHFPVPASPLSMPASPSSVSAPIGDLHMKPKSLTSLTTAKVKVLISPKKQSSTAKGTSLLRSNNVDFSVAGDTVDRIKTFSRKMPISLLPAMHKKAGKSGTRTRDAGAALNRNKLLKIVSQKSTRGESVQLDHDYCSSDTLPSFYNSDPLEYIPQNLVLSITANQRHGIVDDDKCSRKDSGLESGEVSEDSEGALIPSGASSGCETGGSGISNVSKLVLKPKVLKSNVGGRNKDLLMVSVLKKTKNEIQKSPTVESGATSGLLSKPEGSLDSTFPSLKPPMSSPSPVANEQPKKRKLNFEEYRNRQKALEREREKTGSGTTSHNASVVVQEPPVGANDIPEVVEIKVMDSEVTPSEDKIKLEAAVETELEFAKQPEERRRRRQYRIRHSSTSSSDEGQQNIERPVLSEKMPSKSMKRTVLSRSKSRSRSRSRSISCSSTSSCSRSSSRSSSSCSSSSSTSSSSSSCGSRASCRDSRPSPRSRKNSRDSRSQSRPRHRSRQGRSRCRNRKDHLSDRNWKSRRHHSLRRGRSRSRNGDRRSLRCSSFSRSRSRLRSCSFRRRSSSRSRSRSRVCHGSHSSRCSSRSRSLRKCWSRSRDRKRYRSRSRSLANSPCRDRRWSRSNCRSIGRRGRSRRYSDDSRSRSPVWRRQESVDWFQLEKEHNRQVEERRVIYVGRIPDHFSKSDVRERFEVFGPIVDVRLHFRDHADNYGFVTFAYKVDAYKAVEHGNDDPKQPRFDLCFGGRRKFCKERYADLDAIACKSHVADLRGPLNEENSFDQMLREAQAKLRDRKKL